MNYGKLCGWRPNPAEVEKILNQSRHPLFATAAFHLLDSGAGKVSLLYPALKAVAKSYDYWEANTQTIGDCVSHGCANAVDVLCCVEIGAGEAEQFIEPAATEPIYAGSRHEVGHDQLGSGDGSLGGWGATWCRDWGILIRQPYEAGGQTYDLSTYSGSRARQWGAPRVGVPDALEPIAREHPVRTVSLVHSYEDVRDANANGYPVTVASMQGFTSVRDEEGFARASGSWAHQMVIWATDDEFHRPGCLIMNSWGPNWISGPKRHDQPDGSFWVDAAVIDKMVRQFGGDSWAFSQYEGFPAHALDYMLI